MKSLNILGLIGSTRNTVEKELKKHDFVLNDFDDYGTYTYGVYVSQIRTINIKYVKDEKKNELVETIIVY